MVDLIHRLRRIRSVVPPSVLGVSLAVGARPSAELRAAENAELARLEREGVLRRRRGRIELR